MDERARRIGENETIFRSVNEQVETLQAGMAAVSDDEIHIVCECGDIACMERLVVPLGKYEEIRADPLLFFVVPGHVASDVEDVVEQGPGFEVVRKHPGVPGQLAKATDPRS